MTRSYSRGQQFSYESAIGLQLSKVWDLLLVLSSSFKSQHSMAELIIFYCLSLIDTVYSLRDSRADAAKSRVDTDQGH